MQRSIGKTEVSVYPIGLGAMPLSIASRPSPEQAFEVIQAALDAGVTLIDTANSYSLETADMGHNESLIMNALRKLGKESDIRVATKGGLLRPNGDWTVDRTPSSLRSACEKSLKDMSLDSIFLYQLHTADTDVPLEDSMGELKKLQEEGKIQHIGVSNFTPDQVKLALSVVRIESVQNRCHPFQADDYQNGMMELCETEKLSFFPHSPVGGHWNHGQAKDHPVLTQIASDHEVSSYQVMLAWALSQSKCVIPIPGASKPQSIQSSAEAVKVQLTDQQIKEINSL